MASLKRETDIIRKAVRQASKSEAEIDRNTVARKAAVRAEKRGVNVQSAPYLQNIFYSALDEFC